MIKEKTTGMVLGKFLPPHLGHEYLIETAKAQVDQLYIVVDNIQTEVIDLKLRLKWMKEICPEAVVVTLPHELPQYPHEAPNDFWQQWDTMLKSVLKTKIDYVFASEHYGKKLADGLGAHFVMVDLKRQQVPISASKIRSNPYQYRNYISKVARPYFCKKVCVYGPESTGKSTLTQQLAEYYNTYYVPEYAREIIEKRGGHLKYEDMTAIGIGHQKEIDHGILQADGLLIVDTDAITSRIWSKELFGRSPAILDKIIKDTTFDLYLLLDVDVSWVEDIVRYFPKEREQFFQKCENELKRLNKHYNIISGNWDERFKMSVNAIDNILK